MAHYYVFSLDTFILPGDEAIVTLRAVKTPPANKFLRPSAWSPSVALSPTVAALRQTCRGLLLDDDDVDLAEKTRADEASWAAFILGSCSLTYETGEKEPKPSGAV